MKALYRVNTIILAVLINVSSNALAQEEGVFSDADVAVAAQAYVDSKMELTGKLDIYDTDHEKVRHLVFIENLTGVERKDNLYSIKAEFKDEETRSPVIVSISFEGKGKDLVFSNLTILEVKEPPAIVEKEWTDDEITAEMKKNIEKKMAGSGTLDMYDAGSNKVLNLEFAEFKGGVRKFGDLFIMTAQCKNKSADGTHLIDVTLQRQENELILKSIRLK